MDVLYLGLVLVLVTLHFRGSYSETYSVRIRTDSLVNTVDSRFLSITVDPELLVSGIKDGDEGLCMASALSPAYIRLTGPSTSRLTFHNSSIIISRPHHEPEQNETTPKDQEWVIDEEKWTRFLNWSKKNGYDLVFGLNNEEKVKSGIWDPNPAIWILSQAAKTDFDGFVWQLGYECSKQTIEEYFNDLETLRLIVEAIPGGTSKGWKVVAGDITPCLDPHYGDFKDYISLANEMLDAVTMDGDSSAYELDRMSEPERLRLLHTLSKSATPLWLSEKRHEKLLKKPISEAESSALELRSAADWIYSLGHSAKNGFAVHFRELTQKELFEPTLSFYMALLFKNLVGDRVLDVSIDAPSERASLFAHCTSLRHKAVPGAITLYGVNLDDEPSRFSLKLSKKEDGGDILQFILGLDEKGNILINGHPLYFEGDIRPVVKRVRPYRTLVINLPPQSFGFWVLANTKVDACFDEKHNDETDNLVEAEVVSDEHNNIRTKRETFDAVFNSTDVDSTDTVDLSKELIEYQTSLKALAESLENLNKIFGDVRKILKIRKKPDNVRIKRQAGQKENKERIWKLRDIISNSKIETRVKNELRPKLAEKISQFTSRFNISTIKPFRFAKSKIIKRFTIENPKKRNQKKGDIKTRTKRSVETKELEDWSENDVYSKKDKQRYGKLLHKYSKKLNGYKDQSGNIEDLENSIVLNTRISDDNAEIKLSEKSTSGILKKTFDSFVIVLEEFNDKINKLMTAVSLT